MHGEAAIEADELRRSLVSIPNLHELDSVSNDDLYRIIERKTAQALHHAGLSTLPAAATVQRGLIDDAVHSLSFTAIRRLLRPDDPDMLRELNAEDEGVLRSLAAVKELRPGKGSQWGAGVTGA